MAWYPGAERRPLGKQTEPRMRAHNILCVHTMDGSLEGTHAHFADRGYYGVESHFGIGGASDGAKDGLVVQWQDTDFGADANLDGKGDVISVETSDGGDPDRPWSPRQLDALVDLGVWVCTTYDIPPKLVPDTKPGRRGIAYHRQGCDHSPLYRPQGWPYDAWRVPGGVRWSSVVGKTCPGDTRIRQLVDEVIPRIAARINGGGGAAPGSNPATRYREDDSMQLEPGNRTYGKAIPNGATHVVLNFPDGRAANVRIKWIGPKYPTTKGKFPGGDDYPDADWVTNDWTQSGVRRMRPMVIPIPQKGPGVEDTPVALRLSYDWDPETTAAAVGSLDFRFS